MSDCPKQTPPETLLWKESDHFASPRVFMVEGNALGIEVAGHVVIKPLKEWIRLASDPLGVTAEHCDVMAQYWNAPDGLQPTFRKNYQELSKELRRVRAGTYQGKFGEWKDK